MQKAIIDLSKNGVIPVFHAKQGDTSRRVAITLLDNGLPYDTAADAVSVWYRGPSGAGNYSDGIDKDGSTLTILVNPNMTAASGRHTCAVMLSNENGRCTTWNFCVEVAYTPALGSEEAKAYFEAFEAGELAADIAAVDARTAKAVAELNARVSAIIASGTATEGNTELIDIRTGSDGKVYPTAGDAVREQVGGIKSDLSQLSEEIVDKATTTKELLKPLVRTVIKNIEEVFTVSSWGTASVSNYNNPEFELTLTDKGGHTYTPVFVNLDGENAKHLIFETPAPIQITGIVFAKNENDFVYMDRFYSNYTKRFLKSDGTVLYSTSFTGIAEKVEVNITDSEIQIIFNDSTTEIVPLSVLDGYEPCLGVNFFYANRSTIVKTPKAIELEETLPSDVELKDVATKVEVKELLAPSVGVPDRVLSLEKNQLFTNVVDTDINITDSENGYGFVIIKGNTKIIGDRISTSPASFTDADKEILLTLNSENMSLSLSEQLKSVNDTYDSLEKDGRHKRVEKIEMTGKETGSSYILYKIMNDVIRFSHYFNGFGKSHGKLDTEMVCSHFGNPTGTFIKYDGECIFMYQQNRLFYTSISKTTIGYVDGDTNEAVIQKYKNWIAEQYANGTPVTIYYELNDEQITEYTEEEKTIIDKLYPYKFNGGANTFVCSNTNKVLLDVLYPINLTKKIRQLELGEVDSDLPTLLSSKMDKATDINPDWEGWTKLLYPYGFKKDTARIFHEILGTIRTEGMFISQCSPNNRWNHSNFPNGGHVFEGWSVDKLHRLTMLLVENGEDGLPKACIQVFKPTEAKFGWVKLGSDNDTDGHSEGGNGWDFHSDMTVGHTPLVLDTMAEPSKMPSSDAVGDIPVKDGTIYFDENQNLKIRINGVWKKFVLSDQSTIEGYCELPISIECLLKQTITHKGVQT